MTKSIQHFQDMFSGNHKEVLQSGAALLRELADRVEEYAAYTPLQMVVSISMESSPEFNNWNIEIKHLPSPDGGTARMLQSAVNLEKEDQKEEEDSK